MESAFVYTDALLAKHDWPIRIQLDQKGDKHQKWREQYEEQSRNNDVEPSFCEERQSIVRARVRGDVGIAIEVSRLRTCNLQIENIRRESHQNSVLLAQSSDLRSALIVRSER